MRGVCFCFFTFVTPVVCCECQSRCTFESTVFPLSTSCFERRCIGRAGRGACQLKKTKQLRNAVRHVDRFLLDVFVSCVCSIHGVTVYFFIISLFRYFTISLFHRSVILRGVTVRKTKWFFSFYFCVIFFLVFLVQRAVPVSRWSRFPHSRRRS